jgi:hypothetical protein
MARKRKNTLNLQALKGLISTPGIGLDKITTRYKHAQKLEEKVSFKDDILRTTITRHNNKTMKNIKMRELSFSFFGFKCFKIHPLLISVPGRYDGFDVLLAGNFNHEMDVLVCYKKVDRTIEKIRICELGRDTCSPEAEMAVRYFSENYLRKKCRFSIVEKV